METTTSSISVSSKIRVTSAGIAFGVIASVLSSSAALAVPKDCFKSPLCNDAPVFEDPTPPPPPPPMPCKITAKCPVYDPADQVFDPGTGDSDPQPEPEPEPEPEDDGHEEHEPEEPKQDGPEQDGPEDDEPNQGRSDQTQPGGSAGTRSLGSGNSLSGASFTGGLLEVDGQTSEQDSTEPIEDLQQAAVGGDEDAVSSQVWNVLAIATAVAALAAVAFVRRRRQIR